MGLSVLALLAIAGASVAWSALDALRKVLAEKLSPAEALVVLGLVQLPTFGLWLAIEGLPDLQRVGADYLLPGFGLVALNVISNLFFFRAVALAPLSETVPLLSLTPVFTAGVAAVVLEEIPTPIQGVGIGLVVAGAVLLNAPKAGERWRLSAGSAYMLGTAFLWSVTATLDKIAVEASSVPWHIGFQSLGVVLVVGLYVGLTGGSGLFRRATELWKPTLGAGLAASVAQSLQLYALTLTLVGIVEVVKRAIGLVMAVVLGRFVFGEGITTRKLLAVALMGVGTALVAAW